MKKFKKKPTKKATNKKATPAKARKKTAKKTKPAKAKKKATKKVLPINAKKKVVKKTAQKPVTRKPKPVAKKSKPKAKSISKAKPIVKVAIKQPELFIALKEVEVTSSLNPSGPFISELKEDNIELDEQFTALENEGEIQGEADDLLSDTNSNSVDGQ